MIWMFLYDQNFNDFLIQSAMVCSINIDMVLLLLGLMLFVEERKKRRKRLE